MCLPNAAFSKLGWGSIYVYELGQLSLMVHFDSHKASSLKNYMKKSKLKNTYTNIKKCKFLFNMQGKHIILTNDQSILHTSAPNKSIPTSVCTSRAYSYLQHYQRSFLHTLITTNAHSCPQSLVWKQNGNGSRITEGTMLHMESL